MKAYQIVIKGDERSEEYAAMSRESFKRAIEEGYIDSIETFDAITPQSDDFEQHHDRFKWEASLMHADLRNGKALDDHSPSEKAGMCSHWQLMRMQAESDERFWIMEHDTYLIPERWEAFKLIVEYSEGTLYSNIGLFMGMYSMDYRFAHWAYHMLTNIDFPINCGPYCTLQRLFRTFTTHHLPQHDFYGIKNTLVHPWANCDTLGIGRDCAIYFNKHDEHQAGLPNPTTQIISKRLSVTQDHHSYRQSHIDEPWKRHKRFKVVD